MAATVAQTSVNTSATLLATAGQAPAEVLIYAGTADLYIGGSGVTTGNGFFLAAGQREVFALEPGETIYGIRASATTNAHTRLSRVETRTG